MNGQWPLESLCSLGNAILFECLDTHIMVTIDPGRKVFWKDEQLKAQVQQCDDSIESENPLMLKVAFVNCTGVVRNETYFTSQRYVLMLTVRNKTDAGASRKYYYNLECRRNKVSGNVASIISMGDAPFTDLIWGGLSDEDVWVVSVVVPIIFLLICFIVLCVFLIRKKKRSENIEPEDGDNVSNSSWTVRPNRKSIYN